MGWFGHLGNVTWKCGTRLVDVDNCGYNALVNEIFTAVDSNL